MATDNFTLIDNFKCYAPNLAYGNDGFPPDMFDLLATLEENNFWFKARNKILIHLFEKYLGKNNDKKVLEIGCGNGYVLRGLKSLCLSAFYMAVNPVSVCKHTIKNVFVLNSCIRGKKYSYQIRPQFIGDLWLPTTSITEK